MPSFPLKQSSDVTRLETRLFNSFNYLGKLAHLSSFSSASNGNNQCSSRFYAVRSKFELAPTYTDYA